MWNDRLHLTAYLRRSAKCLLYFANTQDVSRNVPYKKYYKEKQ